MLEAPILDRPMVSQCATLVSKMYECVLCISTSILYNNLMYKMYMYV